MPEDEEEHEILMTESTRKDLERFGIHRELEAGGKKIRVVKDVDATEMTVICMVGAKGEYFDDDKVGKCDRCGVQVHHRPHVPIGAILVCLFCYKKDVIEKGLPDLKF